jgi:hypothetical protein
MKIGFVHTPRDQIIESAGNEGWGYKRRGHGNCEGGPVQRPVQLGRRGSRILALKEGTRK